MARRMKTIKKAVAVTIAAIVLMTVWLAAQLYVYDITWSQESDFCIWVSLAQQKEHCLKFESRLTDYGESCNEDNRGDSDV